MKCSEPGRRRAPAAGRRAGRAAAETLDASYLPGVLVLAAAGLIVPAIVIAAALVLLAILLRDA